MKKPPTMREGWGLTHDDEFIYASDGSASIFKIDASTFTVVETL